jgi:hypothetical protein
MRSWYFHRKSRCAARSRCEDNTLVVLELNTVIYRRCLLLEVNLIRLDQSDTDLQRVPLETGPALRVDRVEQAVYLGFGRAVRSHAETPELSANLV